MREYSPEKEYLDPQKQVLLRKYASQKKGEKNSLMVTRRGFYMDYDLKVAKSVPGSSKASFDSDAYKMNDSWDGTAARKRS